MARAAARVYTGVIALPPEGSWGLPPEVDSIMFQAVIVSLVRPMDQCFNSDLVSCICRSSEFNKQSSIQVFQR
jgi:hypothetical protein